MQIGDIVEVILRNAPYNEFDATVIDILDNGDIVVEDQDGDVFTADCHKFIDN